MRTRAALQSRQGFNVPSLIARELRATRLDVAGEKENVDIDAIEQLFRTQRYSGRALWSGRTSAGLLGEFPRWLSDDDAEIGRNQCQCGTFRVDDKIQRPAIIICLVTGVLCL